jgi:hypothetical protein
MKIVGQFNSKPIALESLFITQTYLGYLGFDDGMFPEINVGFLKETLPELVKEHFGEEDKFIFLGREKLDLTKILPRETAIAALVGASPLPNDHNADFSHLIIVWLQEPQSDIYNAIETAVSSVNWTSEAEDGFW